MEQQPYGQQEVYEEQPEKVKGVPLEEPRTCIPWLHFMYRKMREERRAEGRPMMTRPFWFDNLIPFLTLHFLRLRAHERILAFQVFRADQQLVKNALDLLIHSIQTDRRSILDDEEVRGYAVSAVEAVCTAEHERVARVHEGRGMKKDEYYDHVLTCILDEVTDYWSVGRRS